MVIFSILRQLYLTFLYCSPFSYCSSNFAIAKVVALGSWLLLCIALPTIAIAIVVVIFGRAITLGREPSKKNKEIIPKGVHRGLGVITLQGAIEKSLILQLHYWKFE